MRRFLTVLGFLILTGAARADINWPDFRGPNSNGHSTATGLPVMWSEIHNVKWKTPLHGKGWSSPVVWGEQIWLTTATEDGKEMFVVCLDKATGKILHDRRLFNNAAPEPIHDVNSYASPTPVLEDGRVYVHFGSYGTACLDTKTFKTVWERTNLNCKHSVGPGSSPVLFENLLILTYDGTDVQYVVALDKKTGKNVWKMDRSLDLSKMQDEMRKSFGTPLIAKIDGKPLLISPGAGATYAYEPRTGKEIWRALQPGGYSASSRTILGDGLIYVNSGYNQATLMALRPNGSGELSPSSAVWKYTRNVPYKPSPILVNDLLYMVNDTGILTCLDAKTGAEVWKERTGSAYSASPVYADGRLYFFSESGKTLVLNPGRKFEVIAENHLPGGFMASPAIVGKALYLRTKTHLYCVEK